MDFYSDVDLYVIVRDEVFDPVFAERDAAARAIGSPLFRFTVEPMPGGSRDYIVPKWEDRPVLEDDSGSVAAVVSRSAGSGPDRPESLLELEQSLHAVGIGPRYVANV